MVAEHPDLNLGIDRQDKFYNMCFYHHTEGSYPEIFQLVLLMLVSLIVFAVSARIVNLLLEAGSVERG